MQAKADIDSGDLILEDDEPADHLAPAMPDALPWRILIVDDDVDVHVVTKFALSNTHFQGRRLSFLHAYSGKEALTVLRDNPDIAMVLLDVIMETEDAGLRVARQIRTDLGNELVRIVLRTGQPGQALEHSIIVDYDINDFWCKADLTTRKLFTTVIASLRAYATLAAVQQQRDLLQRELEQARQLQAALGRQALVLTLDAHGLICDASEMLCVFTGKPHAALVGRDLHVLHAGPFPAGLAQAILASLASDGHWSGAVRLSGADGKPVELRCEVLAMRQEQQQQQQQQQQQDVSPPTHYLAVATPAH